MRLLDIGKFALALIGKRIVSEEEALGIRFEEFKFKVRSGMYNFDDFIFSDFRIVETYYQTTLQGIAVFKEKNIDDKYFSVPIDKEITNDWTEIKEEVLLDIRDAIRREYINDKENRDDV